MTISIGAEAIARGASATHGMTYVAKDNPASASFTSTSVEIRARTNLLGVIVGIFYTTNGNILKCRDSVAIGSVTAGSEQTITEDSGGAPLSIAVEAGDYIGMYFTEGDIETDSSGYAGLWYYSGERIDPGDEATYTFLAGYAISLKGIGEEAAAGRSFGFIIG